MKYSVAQGRDSEFRLLFFSGLNKETGDIKTKL